MIFQQESKSSTTTSTNNIHSVGIINTTDSLTISSAHPNTVQVSTTFRKRRNTLHILINATMQLLSSPLNSPTSINTPNLVKQDHCSSPTILSNESSYVSFPEFEEYDYNDELGGVNELRVENTFIQVVQMEQFDEMFVNGVRVPCAHLN
ncbi:20524_t:CDS:1 [Dentiscutata erythropus]|uniref:20524_t:CDS:1 n=1 Tax=Dentiscutata erythropus TaxID=1348616 RepID=A0A9N9FA11_9GLOM|nr:20524_t:CDS:1 [Dentiscutata erythropus]